MMSTITIGDYLLDFGLKFVITTSTLSCLCTLLIYYKTIASSISLCLTLAQPSIIKTILNICIVFFWHWLVIVFYQPWDILQNLVVVSVDVQMCFIFFLLEAAVRTLNRNIKEHYDLIKSNSESLPLLYRDEPYFNTMLSTETISELRHVHSLLYGVIQATNKCYGVPAFLITLLCRFLFTLYLYRWLNQDFVLVELLRAWISFQRILYICFRLETLKLEETRISELLNGLDLSPLDIRTQIEFKLFMIQTQNFPMIFTSVQLFILNFSLITSMFTTTMTYLLLLSQLT